MHELIDAAASRFLAAGVQPHDVSPSLSPTPSKVRATAASLNVAYTAEEFEFYLSDSGSKLLLTNHEGNAAAQSVVCKLNIPHGTTHLPEAESEIEISVIESDLDAISLDEVVNEADDVVLFLDTSGTTSHPKGVPLSQQNLTSSVKNIKSVYKLSESDSTVIVLSLFHVHGLMAGLLRSLAAGAAVALPAGSKFFLTGSMNQTKFLF